ncbi:MAG: hypothetical protein LCH79_21345 [Proteobacteria bacterium]|jgi:hypothetical protein|nr:hypothetical protein [Ramlibacter sp.]MCA0215700.1 hypothetical protein [Pseudomonadota bacterium]
MQCTYTPYLPGALVFNGLACRVNGNAIKSEGRVTVSEQGLMYLAAGGAPLWIDRAHLLGVQGGKFGFLPTVLVLLPQDRVLELIAVDAWHLGVALRRITQGSGADQLAAKQ